MLPSDKEDGMPRRGYPAEFRGRVLDTDCVRQARGRRRSRQERIDQGLEEGLTSAERAELFAARRRIRELETEVAIHRKAAELLKANSSPKGGWRPPR